MRTFKRRRSSVTGQFTDQADVDANPAETITETVHPGEWMPALLAAAEAAAEASRELTRTIDALTAAVAEHAENERR